MATPMSTDDLARYKLSSELGSDPPQPSELVFGHKQGVECKGDPSDIDDELSDDVDVTEELSSSKFPGPSGHTTPQISPSLQSLTPMFSGKVLHTFGAGHRDRLDRFDVTSTPVTSHPTRLFTAHESLPEQMLPTVPSPSQPITYVEIGHDAVQAVQEALAHRDTHTNLPPEFALSERQFVSGSSGRGSGVVEGRERFDAVDCTRRLVKELANGAHMRLAEGLHVFKKQLRLRVRSADKQTQRRERESVDAAADSTGKRTEEGGGEPQRVLHLEGRGCGDGGSGKGGGGQKSVTVVAGQWMLEGGTCGSVSGARLTTRVAVAQDDHKRESEREREKEGDVLMTVRGGPWAFMSASLVTHRCVCTWVGIWHVSGCFWCLIVMCVCMGCGVRACVCGAYVGVFRDAQVCVCVHGYVACMLVSLVIHRYVCVYIYVAFMSASLVTDRYVCACMSMCVRACVRCIYVGVSRDS